MARQQKKPATKPKAKPAKAGKVIQKVQKANIKRTKTIEESIKDAKNQLNIGKKNLAKRVIKKPEPLKQAPIKRKAPAKKPAKKAAAPKVPAQPKRAPRAKKNNDQAPVRRQPSAAQISQIPLDEDQARLQTISRIASNSNIARATSTASINKSDKRQAHYKICLGWTTQCDVDASILCFDKDHKLIDNVSFMNLNSKDGALTHSGDDMEGKNPEGDNETISVNMNKLDKKIKFLYPIINVFSGQSSFQSVKGAFCRILDLTQKNEQQQRCKINLEAYCYDGVSNACIMAQMAVQPNNSLLITPKGLYAKGHSMATGMTHIVQQVAKNDFSEITISESFFQ